MPFRGKVHDRKKIKTNNNPTFISKLRNLIQIFGRTKDMPFIACEHDSQNLAILVFPSTYRSQKNCDKELI